MYINESERSVLTKVCYWGPPGAGKQDLLRALYDHFAALDGEHAEFETKRLAPAAALGLDPERTATFVAAAEAAFGAAYSELSASGTLVWLRARTAHATRPGEYHRDVDVFSVSGPATSPALRRYSLAEADAVVFVADARSENREATRRSWNELREESPDAPILLLVNHGSDPDELAEVLDFEGPSFAEDGMFAANLDAFLAAAGVAVQPAEKLN